MILLGSAPAKAQNPYVCLDTSMGNICLELFADVAPATVENFLAYVNGGDYDNTIFHRSVPGFVLQTGGYRYIPGSSFGEVEAMDPVQNEFNRSNVRGTIAMAKQAGNPDSATNEWFVNLTDNSANLDSQNGGFTVFGQVVGDGMDVVDDIAAANTFNLSQFFGSVYESVPMPRTDGCLSSSDFVNVYRAYETTAEQLPADRNDGATQLPEAAGDYSGFCFSIPVAYRDKLYQIIFDRVVGADEISFRVRLSQIILLKDTGQLRATYTYDGSNGMLSIPSVLFGQEVIRNITLQLTNSQILEFKLTSFEKP